MSFSEHLTHITRTREHVNVCVLSFGVLSNMFHGMQCSLVFLSRCRLQIATIRTSVAQTTTDFTRVSNLISCSHIHDSKWEDYFKCSSRVTVLKVRCCAQHCESTTSTAIVHVLVHVKVKVNLKCVRVENVHSAKQRGGNKQKNVRKTGHRMSKSRMWIPLHSRMTRWND